jgi:hypothetical protein
MGVGGGLRAGLMKGGIGVMDRMASSRFRAVTVRDAAEVAQALQAATALPLRVALPLLSPPAAALWLSPALFLAILARGAAGAPGARWHGVLDCGAAPGHALAALRAGVATLVLDPACPAFARIAAAAAQCGAAVWPARPPALEVARLDRRPQQARAQLIAWLGASGDSPAGLG